MLGVWVQNTLFIFLIALASLLFPSFAEAATYTWDGGGSTNNWSECANWSTDVCPTSADLVLFNGTSTKDANVDAAFGGTVLGIQINSGYSGTVALARSLTMSSGDFSLAQGTFDIGSQRLSLSANADFTISGGTFNEGTGTVSFEGNGGTVNINVATTEAFYNLEVNKSVTSSAIAIASGDTITISNTLTHTNGGINGPGSVVMGSGAQLLVGAAADGGTAVIQFTQTGDESISTCVSGGFTSGILVNKPSGTLTLACADLGVGEGDFTIQSGVFATGANTLRLSHNADFTVSGGTFNEGTGTVIFQGAQSVNLNVLTTENFYNLTFSKNNAAYGVAIATGDTINVSNTLSHTDGGIDGPGVIVMGSGAQLLVTSTADGGTAVIQFTQAGDESISFCAAGGITSGILVNKPSGTLTLNCPSLGLAGGDFTLQSGAFSLGSNILTLNNSSDFTVSGGTFNEGTGTVIFQGAGSVNIDVATTETFYNLTLGKNNAAYSVTIPTDDTLIVNNELNITEGRANGGTILVQGNVTISAAVSNSATPTHIIFSGNNNQTFTLGAAGVYNGDISVDKNGGAVNLASNLTIDGTGQDLLIVEGIFDTNGFALAETGTGTFVVQDGGTLRTQGGESVTVPTLNFGSTVEYDGSGTYTSLSLGNTYVNLIFSGSGTFSTSSALSITGNFAQTAGTFNHGGTLTLSGSTSTVFTAGSNTNLTNLTVNKTGATVTLGGTTLDVDGDLTLTAGTLDASVNGCSSTSCNIALAGDWIKTSGSFTPHTGTVTLDGTSQVISGDNAFHNLTKTATIADTLTFAANSTQTVSGIWTVEGADSQLLSLRSSSPATQWSIDPQGTRTLSYLDVQDSHNTNGVAIQTSGLNLTDSGNNTNWNFNSPPDTPSALGPASYVDGSYVSDDTPTLTFTTADNENNNVTYKIEIDDNSDFSSLVVDYTSASAAPGAASFTVGQAAGGGSYAAGANGQSLSQGSYYWRVLASDSGDSSYATANNGAVAFVLDTAAPTTGSITIDTISTSSVALTLSGASDSGSGLATAPYNWFEATDNATTGATTTTAWSRDALIPNTQYSFTVGVTDTSGLSATTSVATTYTLALAPLTASADADSDTAITFAWSGGTNPFGTEYYVENTTAGTNSGWITNTSWTSTGLTASTHYALSVKARNGDGVETAVATSSATTEPATPSAEDDSRRTSSRSSIIEAILPVSSSKSLLIGPQSVLEGNMVIVTVIARNILGQNLSKGGETVTVTVTGNNQAYPSVLDNGDGTYTARYVAAVTGTDTVLAYINQKRITNDTDGINDGSLKINVRSNAVSSPAILNEVKTAEIVDKVTDPSSEALTTTKIPVSTADSFSLQSGLTSSCQRAFSWNHQVAAVVYREIGDGLEIQVATINPQTSWYIDVDPIQGQDIKYRFDFAGDLADADVNFSDADINECSKQSTPSVVVERDIDGDGKVEQFIDGVFQDVDGSSVPLAILNDGILIDTDGDNEPDTFWNPGVGTSPIVLAGDRLFITDSNVTSVTMYEKYQNSNYGVILNLLANGNVALAASGEPVRELKENTDTIIIGPNVFEVPFKYVATGIILLIFVGLGWFWWRRP